ncbi:hypothetical protein JWS13_29730 [Rhodococcus pseudokoreensis]|uniref:HTH-type transcriptional repressor KstR2 C-terminal domain-containing protein n=1 Tax=Rhodococcus pseudokoreensis TaxID=2811421 RepID=A0A974WDE9_9NOCA|nr:hypothetical protein JWS13_29730 [Rhodococcus pseudokoreensis]
MDPVPGPPPGQEQHRGNRGSQSGAGDLAAYERSEARGSQQFKDVIEAGVKIGLFQTPYPDDARRAVIAMCNAVAQWYRPGGELTEDMLIERYVSLALTVVEYRPRTARRGAAAPA